MIITLLSVRNKRIMILYAKMIVETDEMLIICFIGMLVIYEGINQGIGG